MSNLQTPITPELAAYIRRVSLREPDLLRRLREETAARSDARMQVAPEQGQFLGMLVHLMDARRAIEVGVYIFSGYSWFRELPAGVAGAYRVFANMLSAK